MRITTQTLLALTATLASTLAFAQAAAPAPESTLSFNVGVVSDYRFRSVAQTSFKPALQAGIDFSHASGLYVGSWASNVSWIKDYVGASEGSMEIDIYGGYKGAISSDLSYDIGLITYQYPGNTADRVLANANTTEFYGALTFGMFTAKYSQSTGNFIANPNSSGSSYFEVSAALDLGNGFSLTPHVGRQTIPNQGGMGDYTDYSLTLAKDFGTGVSGTIAAYGSDTKDSFYKVPGYDNLGKSGVSVGLKYSF